VFQRLLREAVLLAFVARSAAVPALAASKDSALERGIQQVEAGDWAPALKTLGEVTRRLSEDKKRAPEAAQAHLYSGLAYVGLGETSLAISQFALALKLDPKARIPATRENPAARDAFEVARVEAVSPVEPAAGKRSPLPLILGGVALAAGGVALAAASGGTDQGSNPPNNGVPTAFTPTGVTGTPAILLLNSIPGSGATIQLRQTSPLLDFSFRYEASLPGRVKITVELLGPQGSCMQGTSDPLAVDPAVSTMRLQVASWRVTCTGGFSTTSMNVRLVDADANIPVSLTSFRGGYVFFP